MHDGDNFERGRTNTIYDNVVGVGNEFACARDPPQAVQIRMVWELRNDSFDVVI